jgi:hypothetical protein
MEEEYVQRLVRVRERWLMVQVVQVATLRRVSLVVLQSEPRKVWKSPEV